MSPDNNSNAREHNKIFFGWWTVLVSGFTVGLSSGMYFYGFSAYFKPIQDYFGWTRAQVSAGHALGKLEGGVEGPFGGYLTDKYGPRVVELLGDFFAGLGLILMYFVNSYWQYLLFWGLITSIGFNLAGVGPLETAIANWFVKKRGLAIGLERFIYAGLAGPIVPIMSFILYAIGWRQAFLIAGLITWAFKLPLTWFFVKPKRPEYYGLMPDGVKFKTTKRENPDKVSSIIDAGVDYAKQYGEVEFTVRQMLRTRVFWILTSTALLYQLSWSVVDVHQVPYLIDMGIDPVVAAGALGLMMFISAPGRLIGGILTDRLSLKQLKYLFVAINTAQVLELLIFMRATNITMIFLFVVSAGFTMGVRYIIYPLVRGRFYGRKAFASVQGASALITLPASIISPIYAGWIYDITGSYSLVLTQGLVLLAIGSIIAFFLDPPKPPEKITGLNEFL